VDFLARAIEIAISNVGAGGGPFGAVVARDGRAVAEAGNAVTRDLDPTAHAEVCAIRLACRELGVFSLAGCEIYASCEPCPMCLGAIYWARLDRVYFAATRHDAARGGFDDRLIYDEFSADVNRRRIPVQHVLHPQAREPFAAWHGLQDKIRY
jgi:guanine deaminase